MLKITDAHLVLSQGARRSFPLGDLTLRPLAGGGWWFPNNLDPLLQLLMAAHYPKKWTIEGQHGGELKRYEGGHNSRVFQVHELKE